MKRYLTGEERAEFEALLTEVCGDPLNGPKNIGLTSSNLRDALADAEQAGRSWANHVLDEATVDGLAKLAKDWMKREATVLVAHDGKVVGKSMRVGRRIRNTEGEQAWQQTLFRDMSWAELDGWLAHIRVQLRSLGANLTMGDRLYELRERVPESKGPGDAAKRLGVTIEAWLGEEVA